ncbi:STAS domain-containing protein [Streptomyces sp. SID12488]|uniref:STAS domain-containing protein n=1 Tax=Streptomyces sp. SID12488 TaxID=2706040 RepID=UPI0013DAF408|nr:STAS domain-containing protein [Streptomyces sp. SID12488]NEA64351.1 STAS domain-containing protein [Streptomyces sp. SID12488]
MPREPASPAQQIHVYETEGRTVVQLSGEIDIAVVLRVAAEVDAATSRPNTDVVIDLGPVEFLDCSGLGLLCRARRRTEERGGHLTLACPHPHIHRMLRIVDLDRVFTVTSTVNEALGVRKPISQ